MTYDELLSEWRNSEFDYMEAHTSGSTGRPKLITLSKNLIRSSAMRTNEFFRITSRSHLHSCISPDFIGGKMMAIRADISGAKFTFESPSNRPNPPQWPDLTSVVASQMDYIISTYKKIPSSAKFIVGGSAIHPELRRRIEESGINAWESYGMTETASHIALRRISANPDNFYPLKGIRLTLTPEGCLSISLPYSDIVTTNDLAEISADGSFKILGRADNVIISGGKKIIPEEVEAEIFPGISKFGISAILLTAKPDEKWGEALTLIAEYPDISKLLEIEKIDILEKIRILCKNILPGYKVPKHYYLIEELPKTANGKPIRRGV